MRILYVALVAAFFLTSCGGSKKPDEKAFQESLDSAQNQASTIDQEVIGGILDQIPSPLEISVLLKNSGVKYNSSVLNSPDNLSKYNSNYKKALNLGIYGTDLGYTNIYGQNQDGLKYLSTIKSLAEELNIGQFFDMETIGRLASNSKNLDSLLLITTQNFNAINHYLQSQNRANLSVLFLTGGWIEAVQVTCQVAIKNTDHKDLQEKIAEQKITLGQLMLLLSFYQSDENMASLLKDLDDLRVIFDRINITYTYHESTMEVVNGVAVIKDNSTSTVEMTDQDLLDIMSKTNSIRTKIIS